MYTHVDNSKIDLLHKNVVHWSMYSFFMKKIVFIFLHNTMSMAEAWLRGIGEYPPHPSGFRQYHLVPRLRLGTRGYCLNPSGFGGYSPMPPRHASAIVSVQHQRARRALVQKNGLGLASLQAFKVSIWVRY